MTATHGSVSVDIAVLLIGISVDFCRNTKPLGNYFYDASKVTVPIISQIVFSQVSLKV
jgi:hypothetical protein